MSNPSRWLPWCLRDESGPTAVEYGVMPALIVVVVIAAVTLLGRRLAQVLENVAGRLPARGR